MPTKLRLLASPGRTAPRPATLSSAVDQGRSGRSRQFALGGALVLATIVAYLPAWRCGFIWDDDYYVQQNPTLRSWDGLRRIWFDVSSNPQYYPLVHTSYWVEYRLWGLNPAGYHAVNVGLHALAAVLAWRVLRALGVPGALAAAALFALHPVAVESVAWITERKNVLSAVFYFAAALAYLRWTADPPSGVAGHVERRKAFARHGWYCGAFALFACALLAKTVTCSLPAALLLVLWWRGRLVPRRDVPALAPFFVLGLALGLLTAWLEKHQVRAAGQAWALSSIERLLVAGRALWFYAGKLVSPTQLAFVYPRWKLDSAAAWQYIYPAAAAAVPTVLWLLRTRIGRGPLVAVLFFGGTLVPALGFFDIYPMRYSFVADHFQYLASIGLLSLLATIGWQAAQRSRPASGFERRGWFGKHVALAVLVVILATLGTLTWRQQRAYRNLEALWRDTLRKNPDAGMAHNNLASLLQAQGKADEAVEHYRAAIRLEPASPEAYSNLAGILGAQGRLPEAIEYCRTALRLNPDYAEMYCNLGVALAALGQPRAAVDAYRQALRCNANLLQAANSLAWILATQPDSTAAECVEAVRLAERNAASGDRRNAVLPDTLAAAYAASGQFDQAIKTAEQAQNLAAGARNERLSRNIAARLSMYREGMPYREAPTTQPVSHP